MKRTDLLPKLKAHSLQRRTGQRYAFASEYRLSRVRRVALGTDPFDQPERVADFWRRNVESAAWFDCEKECLVSMMLDVKLRLIGFYMVSVGSIEATLFHPREIFRIAIHQGASGLIVAHNHPSGDPRPSETDLAVTRELIHAGNLIGISVVDHVIIGATEHVSLMECGINENETTNDEVQNGRTNKNTMDGSHV